MLIALRSEMAYHAWQIIHFADLAMKGLRLETLRELVESGAVDQVLLVAQGRKWSVLVRTGLNENPLLTDRGSVREFGKLETAISLIREAGLGRFMVDATNFQRGQGSFSMSRVREASSRSAALP